MDQSALRTLLRRCVVALYADGMSLGTGFFVAPGRLLTCAHVVREARQRGRVIQVYTHTGETLGEAQIERYEDDIVQNSREPGIQGREYYPDLALLRVTSTDHPCVYLDERLADHDELYSYGFSERRYKGGRRSCLYL